MKAINYIVAAAMLFAACIALMGVVSDPSDAANVGDTITSVEDGLTYKVLIVPGGDTHGQVEVSGTTGAAKASYTIPDIVEDGGIFDVVAIGENAFKGRTDITSITLGANVNAYREGAFSGCSSVTELTFHKVPGSIATAAGSESFANFGSADLVVCFSSETSRQIVSGLFDAPGFRFKTVIFDIVDITGNILGRYNSTPVDFDIIITDRTTTLSTQAFAAIDGLRSVVVGKGVTAIGSCTFENCYNLAVMEFNSQIDSYGWSSFLGNSGKDATGGLKLILGEDVTVASPFLFRGSPYLRSVEFGSNVTTIGEKAFYETGLTEVTIPDTITSIGASAFSYCNDLTTVTLGKSLETIGTYAFYYSRGIESVTYNAEDCNMSSDAFRYAGTDNGISLTFGPDVKVVNNKFNFEPLRSVTIIGSDEGISLPKYMFQYSSNLASVDLGNNITEIPDYCFDGCSSIRTIAIGSKVTTIGTCAFQSCRSLYLVDLGENVTEIGSSAFYNDSAIIEVVNRSALFIKAGSTNHGYIALAARNVISDPSESMIKVSGHSTFAKIDGVWTLLRHTESGPVINLPTDIVFDGEPVTSYVILDDSLDLSADTINFSKEVSGFSTVNFSGNKSTTFTVDPENPVYCSIDGVIYSKDQKTLVLAPAKKTAITNIPAGLTAVGDYALANSVATSISLPAGVTTIGDYAFHSSQLTSVDLTGVTSIGDLAFAYAPITTLTIPSSVTHLGKGAFSYCSGLTTVDY